MIDAHFLERVFVGGALDQVVERLQRFVAGQAARLAHRQRFAQSIGAVVRRANRPHLAFLDELGEGTHRFFERRLRIVVVRLVEIDHVGLQAPQRGFDGAPDVVLRQALVGIAHGLPDLGGEHDTVALAALPEPLA